MVMSDADKRRMKNAFAGCGVVMDDTSTPARP